MTRSRQPILALLVVLLLVALAAAPLNGTPPVQAQSADVVYDYVYLVDFSGSMTAGNPSLFSQVQSSLVNMISKMPDGWNLIILPFAGAIDPNYFQRPNIGQTDRSDAVTYVNSLQPVGASTAVWDSACHALDLMSSLAQDTSRKHIQTLILFTDGEDNASSRTQQECLGKYETLRMNGYTYWLWFALGGVDIPGGLPSSITPQKTGDLPFIGVINPIPTVLNLGNLYETGTAQACIQTWYPDDRLIGQEIRTSPPVVNASSLSLPEGMALVVEPISTVVASADVCFTFRILNYDKAKITETYQADYLYELPIQGVGTVAGTSLGMFILPDRLGVHFSLVAPGAETYIHSVNGSPIHFGSISRPPRGQTITLTAPFELAWNNPRAETSASAVIVLDDANQRLLAIPQEVGLGVTETEQASSVQMDPVNNKMYLNITLADTSWKDLEPGEYTFKGFIQFTPRSAVITGPDVDNTTGLIEFDFTLAQPLTTLEVKTPDLNNRLDLGFFQRSQAEQLMTVDLEWESIAIGTEQVTAEVQLAGSNATPLEIPAAIGLSSDTQPQAAGLIRLDSSQKQLRLNLAIPHELFYNWPPSPRTYEGRIVFTPKALTSITGNVEVADDGTLYLPFRFTLDVKPPIWVIIGFIAAGALILAAILFFLLVPRWPAQLHLVENNNLRGKTQCKSIARGIGGRILIGGSEADLTLTGAPDGIFARLKPRVSSSLLGQWLKWAENANYDIQPEPESDLLYMGNQKVEEGTWYEWTTSQPITVMHKNRQWRLELKWIEEEENK